jgi:hypothetical protein
MLVYKGNMNIDEVYFKPQRNWSYIKQNILSINLICTSSQQRNNNLNDDLVEFYRVFIIEDKR